MPSRMMPGVPLPLARAVQLRSWTWLAPVTTMALRPPLTISPSSTKRSAVTVSVSLVKSGPWMAAPGELALRVTSLRLTVTCSKHVPLISTVKGPP